MQEGNVMDGFLFVGAGDARTAPHSRAAAPCDGRT